MKFPLDELLECERCDLHKIRTQVVPPYGDFSNGLFLVGEAPGRNEDLKGKPFVGQAGEWLDAMLEYLKLERSECHISNIVKCRPHEDKKNRAPTSEEMKACRKWFVKELKWRKPIVIVTLGLSALRGYMRNDIDYKMGRAFRNKGRLIFPMYHPATLLYDKDKYYPKFLRHLKKLKVIVRNLKKGLLVKHLWDDEFWHKFNRGFSKEIIKGIYK